MGVEDLWKHCVPGLKTKDQQGWENGYIKLTNNSIIRDDNNIVYYIIKLYE